MNSDSQYINILTGKNSMEYTLLNILRRKYFKEDTLIVVNSDLEALETMEDIKPFFSDKYLLVFYTAKLKMDKMRQVIKKVSGLEYWDVIFVHEHRNKYANFVEELRSTKTVNLNDPPKWLISVHLKMNVKYKFTVDGYEAFVNRMKYQWRYLDDFVIQLNNHEFPDRPEDEQGDGTKRIDMLNAKIVYKLIPKYDSINFNQMLMDMLLGYSMTKHVRQLESYKYAHKYTFKTLMSKLELLMQIKEDYVLGNLTMVNMTEYCSENDIRYYECRNLMGTLVPVITLEKMYKVKHKMLQFKGSFNPLIEMFLNTGLI